MNQIGETRKVAYINRFDRFSGSLSLRLSQLFLGQPAYVCALASVPWGAVRTHMEASNGIHKNSWCTHAQSQKHQS
ncbi:hypothetical protein SAMN05216316_1285 [Nitrosovibrio sp. Nv6]|nr:hypothetical protein SAMN05216316_1285 [Nitrosovibrio sp. Nv6]